MKIFTFLIIFLFCHSVFAQAQIEFDNTLVEYNDVEVGQNGERSFDFQNTGDRPLKISKVVSTSQHLKIILPEREIEPGEWGVILVNYDTKVVGPIRRTISVYTNADNRPVTALKIKGNILEAKAVAKKER